MIQENFQNELSDPKSMNAIGKLKNNLKFFYF